MFLLTTLFLNNSFQAHVFCITQCSYIQPVSFFCFRRNISVDKKYSSFRVCFLWEQDVWNIINTSRASFFSSHVILDMMMVLGMPEDSYIRTQLPHFLKMEILGTETRTSIFKRCNPIKALRKMVAVGIFWTNNLRVKAKLEVIRTTSFYTSVNLLHFFFLSLCYLNGLFCRAQEKQQEAVLP